MILYRIRWINLMNSPSDKDLLHQHRVIIKFHYLFPKFIFIRTVSHRRMSLSKSNLMNSLIKKINLFQPNWGVLISLRVICLYNKEMYLAKICHAKTCPFKWEGNLKITTMLKCSYSSLTILDSKLISLKAGEHLKCQVKGSPNRLKREIFTASTRTPKRLNISLWFNIKMILSKMQRYMIP